MDNNRLLHKIRLQHSRAYQTPLFNYALLAAATCQRCSVDDMRVSLFCFCIAIAISRLRVCAYSLTPPTIDETLDKELTQLAPSTTTVRVLDCTTLQQFSALQTQASVAEMSVTIEQQKATIGQWQKQAAAWADEKAQWAVEKTQWAKKEAQYKATIARLGNRDAQSRKLASPSKAQKRARPVSTTKAETKIPRAR